jgi:site-specific DNA-methyltransferase (adenine-specific)
MKKKTKLLLGDNISSLKKLPDNSVDSVVTDAPYGLGKEQDMNKVLTDWLEKGYSEIKGSGFMGKEWDSYVPQPAFWKEAIRVMKPGAHALSFFGSRTYDIGVMAMRLAGFEIRDTITYNYGSGFPKSHNIQKHILKDLEKQLKEKYNIKEVKWQ